MNGTSDRYSPRLQVRSCSHQAGWWSPRASEQGERRIDGLYTQLVQAANANRIEEAEGLLDTMRKLLSGEGKGESNRPKTGAWWLDEDSSFELREEMAAPQPTPPPRSHDPRAKSPAPSPTVVEREHPQVPKAASKRGS